MKFKIITEAALRNDKIEQSILDHQDECIKHLMCIFLFRDKDSISHWIDEVRAFLHKVPKTKSTKKFPKYNQLYEWLMEAWEDCFDIHYKAFIEDIEIDEDLLVPEFNVDIMHDFLYDYFDWLANELSNNGFVSRDEVKDCINKLLDKYSL